VIKNSNVHVNVIEKLITYELYYLLSR